MPHLGHQGNKKEIDFVSCSYLGGFYVGRSQRSSANADACNFSEKCKINGDNSFNEKNQELKVLKSQDPPL